MKLGMQKKTMLIAALTVAATLAGFVVAGTAFGADWHEYQGHVAAGQAYVVPVPAGADALSFTLVKNGDAPAAKIVVFDPSDARVGVFALADSSDVASPSEGNYAFFVYDLKDAQISVRLQTGKVDDSTLKLAKADVLRADKVLVRDYDGGAVAKDVTINVREEPVFATILYQGQVDNLNAQLSTSKGTVMTVTGESGTSYAPGLAIGSSTAREAAFENLAAGSYRAHVAADALDGTLYLTTLTISRPTELPGLEDMPQTPDTPGAPSGSHTTVKAVRAGPVLGALVKTGVPTEVDVNQPVLAIGLASKFGACTPKAEGKGGDSDGKPKHEDACPAPEPSGDEGYGAPPTPFGGYDSSQSESQVVTVISPADQLVGVYVLTSKDPIAKLDKLTVGKYLVFVHGVADEKAKAAVRVAYPDMLSCEIQSNEVALVQKTAPVSGANATLKFDTPPLGLAIYSSQDTIAVDQHVTLKSKAGTAWESSSLVKVPMLWSWDNANLNLKALVAGKYTLDSGSLIDTGTLTMDTLGYDREHGFGEKADEESQDDGEGSVPTGLVASPLAPVASLVASLGL